MPDNSLFNTNTILDLLKLEQIGEDRFTGQSHFMGSPNVFGGQVLGQSLYAASVTVDQRQPHSLHALFILAGNYRLPIEFEVERVRDGGSFSTRRVVAIQEGRRIFVMSASFQTPEQGLEHQKCAGPAIDPDSLPSIPERWQKVQSGPRLYHPVPVDFRAEHGGDVFHTTVSSPSKQVWTRAPAALPDDPLVHQSLFAYVSDYGLLSTSLQPHGIQLGDPRLQIASLDHSIWFHRPFRMDQWLRFEVESPNASGGRGLSLGHVYDRQGVLVASMAQEGLIRLRER
ncbi:MAG: acyl-CoA thioesterase [Herminiimonas sp.]|nr:acyl-CoA thioesterase [Herminiimonas sp.]